MKHTKIPFALVICIMLGCSAPEVDEHTSGSPGSGTGGGSYASIATMQTTISTLQSGTSTLQSSIKSSPSSYIVTENGVTFIKFQNTTGLAAFNFVNDKRVIYSTEVAELTWDQARAKAVEYMNGWKNQTTWAFRSNVLSLFDHLRANIDGMTFAQFESKIESTLSSVANPPNITGVPKLTAMEQFALTQAYYSLLNQVRWFNENPSNSSAANCLPQNQSEWKDIAKKALVAGLLGGLKMGWDGVVAGAIATGGHPVGGLIGGLTGFTVGFVGGAVLSGGVQLTAGCMINKLFSIKRAFDCHGKIYYAYSVAAPMGCTAIPDNVELKEILKMGVVPNKGKTALAPSVVSDINWLLSFF
jgi:hypothetical protein